MSVAMSRTHTRGVVYVHSTPKALCPHVIWAVEGVLGARVSVHWTDQPAAPGLVRAELSWSRRVRYRRPPGLRPARAGSTCATR